MQNIKTKILVLDHQDINDVLQDILKRLDRLEAVVKSSEYLKDTSEEELDGVYTIESEVEQLKQAYNNMSSNIMGITTDAAVRACNALSTTWGNYSMAIGNKSNSAIGINSAFDHRIQNAIPLDEKDIYIIEKEKKELWSKE